MICLGRTLKLHEDVRIIEYRQPKVLSMEEVKDIKEQLLDARTFTMTAWEFAEACMNLIVTVEDKDKEIESWKEPPA